MATNLEKLQFTLDVKNQMKSELSQLPNSSNIKFEEYPDKITDLCDYANTIGEGGIFYLDAKNAKLLNYSKYPNSVSDYYDIDNDTWKSFVSSNTIKVNESIADYLKSDLDTGIFFLQIDGQTGEIINYSKTNNPSTNYIVDPYTSGSVEWTNILPVSESASGLLASKENGIYYLDFENDAINSYSYTSNNYYYYNSANEISWYNILETDDDDIVGVLYDENYGEIPETVIYSNGNSCNVINKNLANGVTIIDSMHNTYYCESDYNESYFRITYDGGLERYYYDTETNNLTKDTSFSPYEF